MTSKCSNYLRGQRWMGALLLGVACNQLPAGVAPSPGDMERTQDVYQDETLSEKQRPAGDRELPTTQGNTNQQDRNASTVLRCWQDGRLILDEKNWRPANKGGVGLPGPLLRAPGAHFDTLRLMEFGKTFCYLKNREGAD